MPADLAEALPRLRRLQADVEAAETAGRISLRKLDEVGTVRADLADAGASSFVLNEARMLFARAMAIPAFDL